jgi:hypothetical protein
MIDTVKRDGLADIHIGHDRGKTRMKARVPDLGQFMGEFRTRAVGRAFVAVLADFIDGDPWRCGQHGQRNQQPDCGQVEQRKPPYPKLGNSDQRQRHQEEQRNAPVGLDIDLEDQGSDRRPDRHDGLDDPDVEGLRCLDA